MSFWPTADEERWQAVAALAGPSDVTHARSGPWRSFSIFPRIGFFMLGALCSGALWGMVELLGGRKGGMVFAGLVSLAAAEILIIGMKWFRAGVEEALHFCGILLVWGAFVSFSTNEKVLFVTGSVALLIAD